MSSRFADTFYYLAFLNRTDCMHDKAIELTRQFDGTLVTTTAVLTELGDGLARASDRRAFVEFLADLNADSDVIIVPADRPLFDRGMELYASREDKDWSLTDCISFVVMQDRSITDALTGDHHFEQAGFRALLK